MASAVIEVIRSLSDLAAPPCQRSKSETILLHPVSASKRQAFGGNWVVCRQENHLRPQKCLVGFLRQTTFSQTLSPRPNFFSILPVDDVNRKEIMRLHSVYYTTHALTHSRTHARTHACTHARTHTDKNQSLSWYELRCSKLPPLPLPPPPCRHTCHVRGRARPRAKKEMRRT